MEHADDAKVILKVGVSNLTEQISTFKIRYLIKHQAAVDKMRLVLSIPKLNMGQICRYEITIFREKILKYEISDYPFKTPHSFADFKPRDQ